MYLPGELLLHRRDPDIFLPTKLTLPFSGPYEVLEQTRNRVKCRHLSSHVVKDLHLSSLKIFHGDLISAKRVANQEKDQTTVVDITA